MCKTGHGAAELSLGLWHC